MERLGFIGMGNMAQALCAGFVNSGKIAAESVYAYAPHYDKLVKNSEKYGFTPCKTLAELVDAVDTVIMACKPYQINDVLVEIGERLHGKALVSVAAGWDFKKYSEYFDSSVRVQFVMPNTPAMVYELCSLRHRIPLRRKKGHRSKSCSRLWELWRSFHRISWE